MYCNKNCRICDRLVFGDTVTVVAVGGVDTLVINIPNTSLRNCERICLVITQTIPDTATINMPVAISIGGDTTVVYPLVRCDCAQVTACAIRTRTRYPLKVSTSATSAVFKVLSGLSCYPNNQLRAIPAPTATTDAGGAAAASEVQVAAYTPVTRTTNTTKKTSKPADVVE